MQTRGGPFDLLTPASRTIQGEMLREKDALLPAQGQILLGQSRLRDGPHFPFWDDGQALHPGAEECLLPNRKVPGHPAHKTGNYKEAGTGSKSRRGDDAGAGGVLEGEAEGGGGSGQRGANRAGKPKEA